MILHGNALEVLRTLPAESVQMCVTSPPYWGLRNYGTPPVLWGGDEECEHRFETAPRRKRSERDVKDKNSKQESNAGANHNLVETSACLKCGGWMGELGAEPTPEMYVRNIVSVFREVRRVLKKDGTLWLNLGDSYAGDNSVASNNGRAGFGNKREMVANRIPEGLKAKDLVGIPWRVALALQADGWYLRSDIIWAKPNPMPESVEDRPTRSHEYIFLFSRQRKYYYNAEAIYERAISYEYDKRAFGAERNRELGYKYKQNQMNGRISYEGKRTQKTDGSNGQASFVQINETKNKRSVWVVPTKPYSGAHFAVFPEELIIPCILAGSRVGDAVLDPFFGSGTTGAVALANGREYIGIEMNEAYIKLAQKRVGSVSGYLFKE